MFNDLRFAIRMILTRPWFSVTVIVTLALSIGVNTTVFTLTNAALFKPLPLPGGDRLATVIDEDPKNPSHKRALSLPQFLELRSQNHTFASLEAAGEDHVILGENGSPPERYNLGNISTGLFAMLRVPPVLGRTFTEADGRA